MGRRLRRRDGEDRVQMPTCQSRRRAPLTAQISLSPESLAFLDCDIEDIFTQNVGSRSDKLAHFKAVKAFGRLTGPPRAHMRLALLGLRSRLSGREQAPHSPTEGVMSITSTNPPPSLALSRDPRGVHRPDIRRGASLGTPTRRRRVGFRRMPRGKISSPGHHWPSGLSCNKKKVAERHRLHVSATQETGRSDRRMAAQGVRFTRCAYLALQTVHLQDPWPDTLVATVRRLPSLGKEQGSPLSSTRT